MLSGDRFRQPKKKKDQDDPSHSLIHKPTPYTILMMPDARKAYDDLPGNVKTSMDEIMDRLRAWPEVSGVRPLFGKGYAANKFRMKTWDWRIEFTVSMKERSITVTRIGHRDTFYDEYH